MRNVEESDLLQPTVSHVTLPVSVIIPVRNEALNLPRCLKSLRGVGEVYVVDSHSTDETVDIALSYGAKVIQFDYQGGWPKKRQWAMDTLQLTYDWILMVDADEALTPQLADEILRAIQDQRFEGYYIDLRMYFLGRELRHGGVNLQKLSLFRRGKGHFECRLKDQDISMCDMEVHEHMVVQGKAAKLRNPLLHHNYESLSRFIQKHNEYSNWEAQVLLKLQPSIEELVPSLFGKQAQRRRWLKTKLFRVPGSPVLLFLYCYFFRAGFLDGAPGLIYCGFQAVQMFHTKAKMYELSARKD
jgi:glycosyltransferase involved in cell wall biosynthesis